MNEENPCLRCRLGKTIACPDYHKYMKVKCYAFEEVKE